MNVVFFILCQTLISCNQTLNVANDSAIQKVVVADSTFLPNFQLNEEPENIVMSSSDGGKSWKTEHIKLTENQIMEDFFIIGSDMYVMSKGELYHTKKEDVTRDWQKEVLLSNMGMSLTASRSGLTAFNYKGLFSKKIAGTNMWFPVYDGFKENFVRTVFESSKGHVFIGSDKGLYKSDDQGKTWKHIDDKGWVMKIVEADGVLMATSVQGIIRSVDDGETWTSAISEGGVGIAIETIDGGFAAITYNTESKTRRLRTSFDKGLTWQPIDKELPEQSSITSIKQMGKYYFVGHPHGVYRSSDKGLTWEMLLPSTGKKVFHLSISGETIYAVPFNSGC